MIRFIKSSENLIIVTLTENSTLVNPIYLFKFTNQQSAVSYYFIATDISSYKERYNKFLVTDKNNPNTLSGEVQLGNEGFYNYEVYQTFLQSTSGLTIAEDAIPFINKTVEYGVVWVVPNEQDNSVYTPDNLEAVVYQPIEPLVLVFTDVTIIPEYTDVNAWNTLFNLPANGTPFTSVSIDDNTVTLQGATRLIFKADLFSDNQNILEVYDYGEVVSSLGRECFARSKAFTTAHFPKVSTYGLGCFSDCWSMNSLYTPLIKTTGATAHPRNYALTEYNAPLLTAITGTDYFYGSTELVNIIIPSCTQLGATTGNDSIFGAITGKEIYLKIPASLMTCNGGQPDGDIQYLIDNNTVTIETV